MDLASAARIALETPDEASAFDVNAYKARVRAALEAAQARQNAEAEAEARRAAGVSKGATRYTTDYAVAWGRRQGWKLIDRESFDYRTKRHRDCAVGSDAMFEAEDGRIVLVQAAGRGEMAHHRARFEERGGEETVRRRGWRFLYIEFERGSKEPFKTEEWA